MGTNNNKPTALRCLLAAFCLLGASAQAAVVNLSFSEDGNSFISTWQITDNGGGDFSGSDTVIGSSWQIQMAMTGANVLQDTIGHVLGSHGEPFNASSYDYGVLPAGVLVDTSSTGHGTDGHSDQYTMTSTYDGSGFTVSLAGIHVVPIPAALWLFASALGGLGWLRRRTAAPRG